MISLADNGDEQVALIGDAHFDVGDHNVINIVMSIYTSEAVGSDQWLSWGQAHELLKVSGARDLAGLRGYPVWIKRDGNRMLYQRPWSRKP